MHVLLLLLGTLPLGSGDLLTVDLIELNHVYGECKGEYILSQLIFYEWDGNRFQVRSWFSAKSRPIKDFRLCVWRTSLWKGSRTWEVRSPLFRETWTQYDVERDERERFLRLEDRRKMPFDAPTFKLNYGILR